MRFEILLSALFVAIRITNAFIPYPFLADQLLTKLLDVAEIEDLIDFKDKIPGNLCKRECRHNDRKICHYNFALKYFEIMGGYEKIL